MSGHTQDAGCLGDVFPAHKSGKKFATWTFRPGDGGQPVAVEVYLVGSGSKTLGGYVLADAAERAYVRDTPQVREARRDVFDRVADLCSRLAQALSNEAVSAAMKAGGTVALLPVKA